MAIRPILFSGPMVRALLEGRKTQTRRMLKPQPPTMESVRARSGSDYHWMAPTRSVPYWRVAGPVWAVRDIMGCEPTLKVPYAVGDVLWVRESWMVEDTDGWGPQPSYAFMADHEGDPRGLGWKPSIHMPRKASRLTLEVTGVKVERLQDIGEEDAVAEGVCQFCEDSGMWDGLLPEDRNTMVRLLYGSAVKAYRHLWEEINGADSWEANPWIVAPEFTVRKINVDAYLQSREAA